MITKYIILALFLHLTFSCASPQQLEIKENANPKYDVLRNGMRYVIYVADDKISHTEAAIEIENRIKEYLGDRGLVLVDFDQNSLANIFTSAPVPHPASSAFFIFPA